jgi:hypothetical protein
MDLPFDLDRTDRLSDVPGDHVARDLDAPVSVSTSTSARWTWQVQLFSVASALLTEQPASKVIGGAR